MGNEKLCKNKQQKVIKLGDSPVAKGGVKRNGRETKQGNEDEYDHNTIVAMELSKMERKRGDQKLNETASGSLSQELLHLLTS